MQLRHLEAHAPTASLLGVERARTASAAKTLAEAMLVLATGVLAALPVISSTVKALRAGWVPAGDDGIIATRGWDVLSSHTPLVGQYSEAGLVVHGQVMHSPGPMLYWLLAIPARYGGVGSLAVTMCVLNTLAIVLCVALARRRGGLFLMFATALGIVLMSQSLPGEAMHDIWNPAAGLFAFLALIFVGWSLACGDYWLLPLAALLASYVIQTHLMYLAPGAVVVGVGLGGLLVRWTLRSAARRQGRDAASALPARRIWPWSLAAVLVVVACWALPVKEQLQGNPGNLTMIARTVEHRGTTVGGTVGWNALARSLGSRPWWLHVPASEWERKYDVRHAPGTTGTDATLALLAGLVLALAAGAYRRRWDLFAAALIALGLCGAMVLQVANNPASRLLSETLGYTTWWGSELGFWVYLVLVWAVWLGLGALAAMLVDRFAARAGRGRPSPPAWLRPVALALGALGVLAGLAVVGAAVAKTEKPDSHVYEYRPTRALADSLTRLVPPSRTVEYRFGALDLGTQPMETALRFMLVRHGDRVLAQGSFPRLGSYYEPHGQRYQWIVLVGDGTRAPAHMRLAGRMSFTDPWGRDVLSAWVERTSGIARAAATPPVPRSHARAGRRAASGASAPAAPS
jgi:hypothetical protein